MNNFFDKLKITEEEMEEHLKKWEEEMKEEEEKNLIFIKESQDYVMELAYQHLKRTGLIDEENIAYFPEKYAFSSEYFNLVFDNLSEYAMNLNKTNTDDACSFPNEIWYLKYKDLNIELHTMSGQGTAIWMNIAKEDSWKEELSFTYEDYKNSLPKE